MTANSATVSATVNPNNQPSTTYYFEYGPTADIFTTPKLKETEDYVTGRFG